MKKAIIFVFSILIFLFIPINVFAQEKNITLEKGETINQNPYVVAGENIDISGIVNGDVIAAGGQINISGKINGDLIATGGNIRLSGEVTQNVRMVGGQITISGKVGKNLLIGSGNLEISENAVVVGYLVSGSGNASIFAPIGGNVTIGSGNLSIYKNINGNLLAASEQIYISPEVNVKGDFEYWSKNDVNVDSKVIILGETIKHDFPKNINLGISKIDPVKILGGFIGLAVGFKILSVITLLFIGFLMIKLFPNLMNQTEKNISEKAWKSILIGFLVMIIFPISFIVLLITVIGIPVAFILAALYGIYIYLSKIFVIYWLGGKILNKSKSKYLSFTVASLIYMILLIVPPISGVVRLITTLLGFGAVLLSCKEGFAKAKTSKII